MDTRLCHAIYAGSWQSIQIINQNRLEFTVQFQYSDYSAHRDNVQTQNCDWYCRINDRRRNLALLRHALESFPPPEGCRGERRPIGTSSVPRRLARPPASGWL